MDSMIADFEKKTAGSISREEYWELVRHRLKELEFVSSFLNLSNIEILIKNSNIWVIYKFGDSNESFCMKLDTSDTRSVPFLLVADKEYERFQSFISNKLFATCKHFSDIGANMGYYTLSAVKASADIDVHAFEPNKDAVKLLTTNLEENVVSHRVKIVASALGDEDSQNQEMYIPKFIGSGGGSFKNLHPTEENVVIKEISVIRLDAFAEKQDYEVDIMKIDVEGSELAVMTGAIGTIRKFKPTIIIELLRKWMKPFGHTPQDVVNLLANEGYICFEIDINSLNEIQTINEFTLPNNFIFVHRENKLHNEIIQSINLIPQEKY